MDLDPEETFDYLKKGMKKMVKKTSKLVNTLENKLSNGIYKEKHEDLNQYHQNKKTDELGNDILFFEGGHIIEQNDKCLNDEELTVANKTKEFKN